MLAKDKLSEEPSSPFTSVCANSCCTCDSILVYAGLLPRQTQEGYFRIIILE